MRLQSGGGTRSPDDYEDVVGGKLQSSDGTHLFSPPGGLFLWASEVHVSHVHRPQRLTQRWGIIGTLEADQSP